MEGALYGANLGVLLIVIFHGLPALHHYLKYRYSRGVTGDSAKKTPPAEPASGAIFEVTYVDPQFARCLTVWLQPLPSARSPIGGGLALRLAKAASIKFLYNATLSRLGE